MGAPSRATIFLWLVTCGPAALAAFACSSEDPALIEPVYPSDGGGGGGGSSSSSSGGGSTSSSSSGSAPKPDAGEPEGDSGLNACTPIAAQVDIRTIAVEPEPTGGAIPDGSYRLTDAKEQSDGADGGVIGKRGGTLIFAGKRVAWHFDTNFLGEPVDECCVGSYSIINTVEINMGLRCNGSSTASLYTHPYSVITDAGAPQVRFHSGSSIDTYTKE